MTTGGFSLFDPNALAIVLGGTLLASALVKGWSDTRSGIAASFAVLGRGFDEAANRSALARVVHAVRMHGRFGAEAPLPPDSALAALVVAYLRMNDEAAIEEAWATRRAQAKAKIMSGSNFWRISADHAPVFGLVGTLYAITHLGPVSVGAMGADTALSTGTAIAGAVVSTLYGLMFAHLVCLPLASALARRARADDAARVRLERWFHSQLPQPRPVGPAQLTPFLKEAV